MPMKSINQIELGNKRVLIRVDFNVPVDEQGRITDGTRISAHLPTIDYALSQNARPILASHMGRPKGQRAERSSLKPVAERLSQLARKPVTFLDDCIGDGVERAVADMKKGEILLLENLRFHAEEEKNSDEFARQLARICDVYIDDAFAVSHRAAASNVAITGYVKECAAGFLLEAETRYFSAAMNDPIRPLVAVIGGAKVSDKIGALNHLIEKVDTLLVGGAMAFTFLKAKGFDVGISRCEDAMIEVTHEIMAKAADRNVNLWLPVDVVMAKRATADAEVRVGRIETMSGEWMGLDIGPETATLFSQAVRNAGTVVWNGPPGLFEFAAFSKGTMRLVQAIANTRALTIVGGGDTVAAVHKAGVTDKISYISTGGGAFLALLEGKTLPGIAALEACGHNEMIKKKEPPRRKSASSPKRRNQ